MTTGIGNAVGVRKTETCLIVWSQAGNLPVAADNTPQVLQVSEEENQSIYNADVFYDSGDQGCGEGPLGVIAALMRKLEPGQTLELRATDPTAGVDLPAWCRMTGHTIIKQQADRYLIRKSG